MSYYCLNFNIFKFWKSSIKNTFIEKKTPQKPVNL